MASVDRRWLLGGLLTVLGVGLVAAATRRPKLTEKSRVLLVGDSMAVGLDPHMRELAGESAVEAYAGRGITGSRIDQWARSDWLESELESFRPTIVLVSLGTNDEALGRGAAERQAPFVDELLEKLRASGAEVVWIGPPTLPFEEHGVSELIESRVPFYFRSAELDIPRSPDGLHPNAAGYAGWSGAVWRWLS
jgi:lysophospholipase L1-like esterase